MASTSSQKDQEIIKILKGLGSIKAKYPPKLLAARRRAFISQIMQQNRVIATEAQQLEDQEIVQFLAGLQTFKAEYPPELLAARRSAFMDDFVKRNRAARMETFRSTIQNKIISFLEKLQSVPIKKAIYVSLVFAAMAFAIFWGSLIYRPYDPLRGISKVVPVLATHTPEPPSVNCKIDDVSPLCLAESIDTSQNLSFQDNGFARAAVAKDIFVDHDGIHTAAFANDGRYGKRSRWVSNSAYSWLKIDLGQSTLINTVALVGRDRLNNHNPGQFMIAIALSDNIYADGDSSNDGIEYKQVYDSKSTGLISIASSPETDTAYFETVMARFVKITFIHPGEAISEVQVFLFNPIQTLSNEAIRATVIDQPQQSNFTPMSVPTNTLHPTITLTSVPSSTPTAIPTDTLQPTDTATQTPTETLQPADTATQIPTTTPQPTDTPTDTPPPTETLEPLPTDTLEPVSTP